MPWHRLYSSDIIKKQHIRFREGLSLGEDLIFNLDYLDAVDGSIVVANKVCCNYTRTENDSLDHKYRPDLFKIYQQTDARILNSLQNWKVEEASFRLYRNSVFYHYEHMLKNTFHKQNKQSHQEKLSYNNELMNSLEFKKILEERDCFVHPFYLRAYKSGDYRNVLAVEKLVSLKNIFRRRK